MDRPRATFHSIHPVDVRELRKCKQVPGRPYRTTPTLWPICEMGRGLPRYRTIYSFPYPTHSSCCPPFPLLLLLFSFSFPFQSLLSPCFPRSHSIFHSISIYLFHSFSSPLQSFHSLSLYFVFYFILRFPHLFSCSNQPSTTDIYYSPREISTRIPRELGTKLADSDDWQIKFSIYRHDRKSEDR